jgi:hypothetical protein
MTPAAALTRDNPVKELLYLLNQLLEAERAGAAVLRLYVKDYEPNSTSWNMLRIVQLDEAANCAVLVDLIRRAGGRPSLKTGDFLAKASAIEGKVARLQFLNRGQGWVVRKLGEALTVASDAETRDALQEMLDSHVNNIRDCESLINEVDGNDRD